MNGAEYGVPMNSVGVLPSSVYRIEAPDVVESVIVGALVQASPPSPGAHPPPEMVIDGVAIVPAIV